MQAIAAKTSLCSLANFWLKEQPFDHPVRYILLSSIEWLNTTLSIISKINPVSFNPSSPAVLQQYPEFQELSYP